MESYRIAMPVGPLNEDVWGKMEEEGVFFDSKGNIRPPNVGAKDVESIYGKVPPSEEELAQAEAEGRTGRSKPKSKAPQFNVGTMRFYDKTKVYTINGQRYIIIGDKGDMVLLGNTATGEQVSMPRSEVAAAVASQDPYIKENLKEINDGISLLNKRTSPEGLENATKTFQNIPLQVAALQNVIQERVEILNRIVAASKEKMEREPPSSIDMINKHMDDYINGQLGRRDVRDFMDYILTRYQYNYGALIEKVSRDGVEGVEEQLKIDTPEGVDKNLLLRFIQKARDAMPPPKSEPRGQEFNLFDYAIEQDIQPLSIEDMDVPITAVKGYGGYEGMKKSMYATMKKSEEAREHLQAMSDKLNEFFGFMKDMHGISLTRAYLASEAGQSFLGAVYNLLTAPEVVWFVKHYTRNLIVDGRIDPKKLGNAGASAGSALVACGFLKLVAVLKKILTDYGFDPSGPDGLEQIVPPSRRRTPSAVPAPAPASESIESEASSYKSAKIIFKHADNSKHVLKITRADWEVLGVKNKWIC